MIPIVDRVLIVLLVSIKVLLVSRAVLNAYLVCIKTVAVIQYALIVSLANTPQQVDPRNV